MAIDIITHSNGRPTGQLLYTRYFFVSMAAVFIVMAAVGFGQSYQMMLAQNIVLGWFVHAHGGIMGSWLLVFFIQAILAAKSNFRFHERLGQFASVLGVFVFISMFLVIFHAHIGYPFHENIPWAVVLFLGSYLGLFALFFVWGISARKNAAVHKRLILLATLMTIAAGFNRVLIFAGVDTTLHWPLISNSSLLGHPNPSALLLYNDLLLVPLFIYDLFTVGRIHSTTLAGTACILAVHIVLATTWLLLS